MSTKDVRRIIILRALALGDLLCAVPAFRALRAAFPHAEITLAGLPWAAEFVRRFSRYLDAFLEFPGYPGLPERPVDVARVPGFLQQAQSLRFDLALQMHGSGSIVNSIAFLLGAKRTAGYFPPGEECPDPTLFMPFPAQEAEVRQHLMLMSFLGISGRGEGLEFPILPEDLGLFSSHPEMAALRSGAYVCVHPGARLPSRRWPAERFAAVADDLADRGLVVVLTGGAGEKELTGAVRRMMRGRALDLGGETTLGTLAILLQGARLLVSNDTGISHLAAAVRTPSVVVANGSDPGRWAPLDRVRHRVLWHEVDCRPCAHEVCPLPGHPCALGVSAGRVVREVRESLDREESPCAAFAS